MPSKNLFRRQRQRRAIFIGHVRLQLKRLCLTFDI